MVDALALAGELAALPRDEIVGVGLEELLFGRI